MKTIVVERWDKLNQILYVGSWKENLQRFRSDFAYRGLSSTRHDLQTSLMRLGDNSADLEQHLLRAFRRYAYRYASFADSLWNWLALAQHHGLPTRLLDFTYSPYVALHFATANPAHEHEDALVWCVDYVRGIQFLPDRLKSILRDEGASVFTAEMLSSGAQSLPAFGRLADAPFVAFFEPPSFDDRIVNQFALFALMSQATTRLDDWLQDHDELAFQVLIPAALKGEVRDKLDQANITERVLLPGLDGLSAWLARYYRPRKKLAGNSESEAKPTVRGTTLDPDSR
ncbi:MAG TPA: FRG domain-containing protein [Roseiflexaceae bacterium]|nr:FRG domain-containing protein [Roseiflexaceae bacterium]